ncbi:MAG: hypothetical protein E6767_08840 [Dysgonomonas sp.]|nr:hypothetical protein [Dysgonomonas sp.]
MKKMLFISIIFICFCSCRNSSTSENTPPPDPSVKLDNAIYYWKTTFSLNDAERKFLSDNNIKRLYIRYFDVACKAEMMYTPAPKATIRFKDSIPANLEVIPTIFIDNELFKVYGISTHIAESIVKRILVMSKTNDVPNVHEIQIDCDWTKSSEEKYFSFLKQIKQELKKHNISLSATIRFHQLRMDAPPVDRGVLMCYNTGAVLNKNTKNSILEVGDVDPYASSLIAYQLPLDIAYPTFSWGVWFRYNSFKALLRGLNPDNENLEHVKDNIYKVKNGFYQEGHYLAVDDEIRFESSPMEEIVKAKELLEHQLKNYSIIIYHLDSTNLSKYTQDEINKIYNN